MKKIQDYGKQKNKKYTILLINRKK